MADTIGVKMKVEGETSFSKAMRDAAKSLLPPLRGLHEATRMGAVDMVPPEKKAAGRPEASGR